MRLRPFVLAALLAATPALHAQTVVVEVAPGSYQRFEIAGPARLEIGDRRLVITWGPAPAPDPVKPDPVKPDPPTPPPPPKPDPVRPVETAAWLVCIWDDAATTPGQADIRNSRSLDAALAPTRVIDYSTGTPAADKYAAYLAARGVAYPAYLLMDAKGDVYRCGSITTEAALIEASKNLR